MTPAPNGAFVTVRVPSKVNVELVVGPLRDDGYHDLATVFQALSIYDDITVRPADRTSVVVRGDEADAVPTDESNLAMRAAALMDERHGTGAVRIEIDKSIPVAGGMAGGSADAAGTLVAIATLCGLELTKTDLEALGADLGSDVPFLISGGTAVATGRGELIAPVLTRGSYHWVLVLSRPGLSTPQVYGECDRLRGDAAIPAPVDNPELMAALRSADPEQVAPLLRNDLQAAALSLRPDLESVLRSGLEFGALGGLISGSGPTIAFLTRDSTAAIDLAVALTASGVAKDVRRASGPVPGAHVIDSSVATQP